MSTTHSPDLTRDERAHRVPTTSRTWALAGLGAGVAGVVGIQASLGIDAVYDKKYAGDADKIADRLGDVVPQLLVLHFGMVIAALLMLVFAAGLRRRLSAQAPSAACSPTSPPSGSCSPRSPRCWAPVSPPSSSSA